VQFSNHTGYGAWKGRVYDGPMIEELVDGIAERGVLGRCDGVLSGYMGSADIGTAILGAVSRVRSLNPKAHYCCDPVIGDVGRGIFVRPGIPEFMRDQAVPAADIITPNQFELEYLAGRTITTIADAVAAVEAIRARGPRIVMVTSLVTEDTPADAIDLLACGPNGRFRVRTPRLAVSVNGAGDAIAALFFVHAAASGDEAFALSRAASSVFGLLRRTGEAGSREILTVAAQDEFVTPSRLFTAEPIA
jgi:pyridoxine kinase